MPLNTRGRRSGLGASFVAGMSAAALTEMESTEARAGGLPRRVGPPRGALCLAAAALLLHPRYRPVQSGPAALRVAVAGAAALPRHEADEVVEPEGEDPQQLDDEEPHGPDGDPEERPAEDHLEHDEDAERHDGPAEVATRGAVVALGVFVVLQVVLGRALLRVAVWPVWLLIIELLWIFALWLYYFIRFMTRQRSGPGDRDAQRRGAALDGTISRMEQERRGGETESAAGRADAPR